MRIKIKNAFSCKIPPDLKDDDLGLKYITNSVRLYDVIDKQKFFLMVIKYAIEFEDVHKFDFTDYYTP